VEKGARIVGLITCVTTILTAIGVLGANRSTAACRCINCHPIGAPTISPPVYAT
jgi:hypothetical protein